MKNKIMHNDKTFEELIFRFAGKDLTGQEEVQFLDHLNQCEKCRKMLSEYETLNKRIYFYYGRINTSPWIPAGGEEVRNKYRKRFREKLIYLSAAASLVIGFLLFFPEVKKIPEVSIKGQEDVQEADPFDNRKWLLDINSLEKRIEIIESKLDEKPL